MKFSYQVCLALSLCVFASCNKTNYDDVIAKKKERAAARLAARPADGLTISEFVTAFENEGAEVTQKDGQIVSVKLSDVTITDPLLEKLAACPKLNFLQLSGVQFPENGFEQLASFPALKQIRCPRSNVSSAEIATLASMKSLTALDLSGNPVEAAAIEDISGLPLTLLKLSGEQIDDQALDAIVKIESLKVLNLNQTSVTGEGLQKLLDLPLQEINLAGTPLGDDDVMVLSKIPSLISDSLTSVSVGGAEISEEGVAAISELSNLRSIDLSGTHSPGVTADSAEKLLEMNKLEKLNLYDTQIDDEVVETLSQMKSITWLNIDKTQITDKSLKILESMPQLTWLHVGSNSDRITDEGAESLLKLENLSYLNISKNAISKAMFEKLHEKITANGGTVIW